MHLHVQQAVVHVFRGKPTSLVLVCGVLRGRQKVPRCAEATWPRRIGPNKEWVLGQDCRFCVTVANPQGEDCPLIAVSKEFETMTGGCPNERPKNMVSGSRVFVWPDPTAASLTSIVPENTSA